MRRVIVAGAILIVLAACEVSPERAAEICEERARAAAGPTGKIGIGVGSGGATSSIEIGVTGDYLRGRDPMLVYESCVREMTGQGPVRPPVL